jgi:hypothetical protein
MQPEIVFLLFIIICAPIAVLGFWFKYRRSVVFYILVSFILSI